MAQLQYAIMISVALMLVSIFAGFLGSILGLGGGLIVVPVLTLAMGVNIRYAIAASLISIVATSCGAAAGFLRDHLTNMRLAVFLELGTVSGALLGFYLSHRVPTQFLFLLFGFFLLFSAVMMLRRRESADQVRNHPWAVALKLDSSYPTNNGQVLHYSVDHVPFGLISMFGAGILSALLGIGSGILKVLAMDSAMKLPIKVSSATSNFMIGVTASASAVAFLLSGDVRPEIAAPVSVGVLIGSLIGARTMAKMPGKWIRWIFVFVLAIVSLQMIREGLK